MVWGLELYSLCLLSLTILLKLYNWFFFVIVLLLYESKNYTMKIDKIIR